MLRYPNLRVGDRVQVKMDRSAFLRDGIVVHAETGLYPVEISIGYRSFDIGVHDELLPPTLTQLIEAFCGNPSNERLRGQLISAFKYGDI